MVYTLNRAADGVQKATKPQEREACNKSYEAAGKRSMQQKLRSGRKEKHAAKATKRQKREVCSKSYEAAGKRSMQ